MMRSVVFVRRLSWLGFRFMAGIVGLMNDGDVGSETRLVTDDVANGGCIDKPFMFLGRRGDGDVMGRSRVASPPTVRVAMLERPPKDGPGNEARGTRLTGESGEDEGEGSERDEESVQETVVVGDESADSEFCVEVLS